MVWPKIIQQSGGKPLTHSGIVITVAIQFIMETDGQQLECVLNMNGNGRRISEVDFNKTGYARYALIGERYQRINDKCKATISTATPGAIRGFFYAPAAATRQGCGILY